MDFKISVIIPIYNVESYILRCLHSIILQETIEDIECILVDDCSTDATSYIVKEFIDTYHGNIHFVYVHHEINKGVSEARNTAMKLAKGTYLYFIDSDDFIDADCLSEMIRLIDKYPDVDMVISNNELNDVLCAPFGEYTENIKIIKLNLLNYHGRTCSVLRHMVKRQLIISNNLKFQTGIIHEDNLWTFIMSKYVRTMAFSNEAKYHYSTENQNSIMRSKNVEKEIMAYKVLMEQFRENINPTFLGLQKKFILSNLQSAIKEKYYHTNEERKYLIEQLASICTLPETFFLKSYFVCRNKFVKRVSLSLLHKLFCLNG